MEFNGSLVSEIKVLILQSREQAIRAVDHARVLLYWNIGKRIFEEEQAGKERADYGTFLIRSLSEALQPEFGSGFSVRQLERSRQFYRMFPITSALRTQFSWTHYKLLLSIDNEDKREYYGLETSKNNWTARQLERQINSQLYERLLLSNDVTRRIETRDKKAGQWRLTGHKRCFSIEEIADVLNYFPVCRYT